MATNKSDSGLPKTAAAIRRSWSAEALLALVPMDLRPYVWRVKAEDEWVEVPDIRPRNDGAYLERDPNEPPTGREMVPSGVDGVVLAPRTLEVLPGQNPLKPVIRTSEDGRVVAGSGRYPMANNIGAIGAATAWKRSKTYREAIEKIIPFEDPDARFTLERLVEDAFDAAEGSPQQVKCPHCGKVGITAFKKDGQLIFKLIELVVGQAPKTVEIKGDISVKLQEVMNARDDAAVITMSKEEWEGREARLLASGVLKPEWLEGEFREVEDPTEKVNLPE